MAHVFCVGHAVEDHVFNMATLPDAAKNIKQTPSRLLAAARLPAQLSPLRA